MSTPTKANVAFISGPTDCRSDYFSEHYKDIILKAIKKNHSFVLGAAPGIDRTAFWFLTEQRVEPSKITIYFTEPERLSLDSFVNLVEDIGVNIKVVGETTDEKNTAMTEDSGYDILRCMSVPEQKAHLGKEYYSRVPPEEWNVPRRNGSLAMFKDTVHTFSNDEPRKNRGKKQSFWSALFGFSADGFGGGGD
ncbi:hypothetical protein B0H34DRAFT_677159 [Crassisporium funariophilum]|nr:hypothetical protein B0H34DRAFT_677159 [Crassisporium funariophilum]